MLVLLVAVISGIARRKASTSWPVTDRPSEKYRRCHDRCRQRRFIKEDYSRRAWEILLLKEAINTMVDQLNGFAAEVTRVAREVGTDGKLGGQAQVPALPAHGRI